MKFIAVVAILVIIVTVFTLLNNYFRYESWLDNREVVNHYVKSGDTLYDIGIQNKPSWMDIREWCYEVCKLNEMKSSDIRAGQTIKIYIP